MAKPISTSDYDAVVAVVEQYCQGFKAGNAEDTAKAFHQNAVMFGAAIKDGPISTLYDRIKANGPAADIRYRIDVLGITPTAATVRVDMELDARACAFVDFHSLVKQEGKWIIVSKVFHRYDL